MFTTSNFTRRLKVVLDLAFCQNSVGFNSNDGKASAMCHSMHISYHNEIAFNAHSQVTRSESIEHVGISISPWGK